MARAQHLYRRDSGIYFVRLCVPSRLKAAVGKSEIHRTTGVRDYRLAKIVAAELAAHWHRALQALERMDVKKIKAGSIELLGEGHLALPEAAKVLGAKVSDLAERLCLRRAPFLVAADKWLGWAVKDVEQAVDYFADPLTGEEECVIDRNKLTQLSGPQRPFSGLLSLRFPEEAVEVAKSLQPVGICQFLFWPHQTGGLIVDVPGQVITPSEILVRRMDLEAMRFDLARQITPEMLAVASDDHVPHDSAIQARAVTGEGAGAARRPCMPFSAFFAEYMKRNEGFWKQDQVRRRRDQAQAFLELMGDVDLHDIDRRAIRDFSDQLARIPDERHNVKRRFGCSEATFGELIELADKHDLPRLTPQAQQRMLDGISEILSWAVTETLIPANPASQGCH